VSSGIYTASLLLHRQTQTFFLLEYLSAFFHSISFFLLLLLWFGVLAHLQKLDDRRHLVFRGAVLAVAVIAVLQLLVSLIWLLFWPGSFMITLHDVFRYIYPLSQAALLIIFSVFLGQFIMWKRHGGSLRRERQTFQSSVLQKMTILALINFLAMAVKAVATILSTNLAVASSVSGLTTVFIVVDVIATIRVVSLLLVLSLCAKRVNGQGAFDDVLRRGHHTSSKAGWTRMSDEPQYDAGSLYGEEMGMIEVDLGRELAMERQVRERQSRETRLRQGRPVQVDLDELVATDERHLKEVKTDAILVDLKASD